MKIICTHCQVGYQVNLPPIKEEGIEVKCARCHQKFMVKPQVRPGQQTSTEARNQIAATPPHKQGTASVDDLNHLLDNLLNEHLAPGTTKSAETPLKIEKAPETETTDTTGAEKVEYAKNGIGDKYIESDPDEEPEVTQKKKFGLFTLPLTKVSKLVILGSVMALVLTGGGLLYFASKTFAPDELASKPNKNTKITETERETAPESNLLHLPSDFLNEEVTPEMTKSAGSSPDSEKTFPSPNATEVTLSTIIPVVFNATDVRVLSFNLEIETTDQFSAEAIRKATPVYEQIMVATIESFLRNKSYNDLLDIDEKLRRRLQNNINQKIEGDGRIKKVTFKDFVIQ